VSKQDVLARIETAFGHRGFPTPLFYTFPIGLRFELGVGKGVVPRFVSAFTRSRRIAHALFEHAPSLTVVWVRHQSPGTLENVPVEDSRALKEALGFDGAFGRAVAGVVSKRGGSPGDAVQAYWFAAEVPDWREQIDGILWSSCAREMAIRPRGIPGMFYLVDFERRLALHVYDDRGMDVVAMNHAAIARLYHDFGDWLLDYDRKRMAAVFEV
jgi:hypothetical protein